MKEIENLKLSDLKQAFKDYMQKDWIGVELDKYQMRREWEKFYTRIAPNCDLVEVEK